MQVLQGKAREGKQTKLKAEGAQNKKAQAFAKRAVQCSLRQGCAGKAVLCRGGSAWLLAGLFALGAAVHLVDVLVPGLMDLLCAGRSAIVAARDLACDGATHGAAAVLEDGAELAVLAAHVPDLRSNPLAGRQCTVPQGS